MEWLLIIPWAVLLYFQNMAFSWASRSRNSGDPKWHLKAARFSNGIWFFSQSLMFSQFLLAWQQDAWYRLLVLWIVYTETTARGSVGGMIRLLKRESGKQRVGAR